MSVKPVFQDWTAKAVEHRVLEAAETLMLCPRANGPKVFGSSMPHPLRRPQDAYAADTARYRRRPRAAAIDRMEECWDWINRHPVTGERHLLYNWARTKCASGRSLKALARCEGLSERMLRREISRICRIIAEQLNAAQKANLHGDGDRPTEATVKSSEKTDYQQYWRAHNARPEIDPAQRKSRVL